MFSLDITIVLLPAHRQNRSLQERKDIGNKCFANSQKILQNGSRWWRCVERKSLARSSFKAAARALAGNYLGKGWSIANHDRNSYREGFQKYRWSDLSEILLFVSLWQEKGSKYDGFNCLLSSIIQLFFNYVTCGSPKQCKWRHFPWENLDMQLIHALGLRIWRGQYKRKSWRWKKRRPGQLLPHFCQFLSLFCYFLPHFCQFLSLFATFCHYLSFFAIHPSVKISCARGAQEDKCRERRPRRPTAGEGKFWSICSRTLIPQMAPICFPYASASHFKVLLTLSATAIIWQLGKEKFLTAMKAIGTKCPAYPLNDFLR